jgi:hypothetical protein
MTLEEFTLAVKADDLWLEAMRNPSRGKSLPDAIAKVYGQAISDGSLKIKPITEHRKHIFNTLGTQAFSKVTGVQLQQPVKEETKEEQIAFQADYETHQKRLADWLKSIEQIPSVKRMPKLSHREIEVEGQVRPNKPTYISDPSYVHENAKLLFESRVKIVRERHPEFSEEDIKLYVMQKFSAI